MSRTVTLVAAFVCGFIALSYEILWFRVLSFVTSASAPSFGVILGFYLGGIAVGSLWSRRFCKDATATGLVQQLRAPSLLALVGAIAAWLFIPLFARWLTLGTWVVSLPVVALIAGTFGSILPLIAHFGIAPDADAGQRLSHLYLANIAGCTLGSLVTGFVFFEWLSLAGVCLLLGILSLALAVGLFLVSKPDPALLRKGLIASAVTTVVMVLTNSSFYDRAYERMMYREAFKDQRFAEVIENRHGVIHVSPEGVVYGGGVYDGVFNPSPIVDRNLIFRAYAMGAFHEDPKSVLMIGLATGSWAQVVAHHPSVERLVVLEINPGYIDLVRSKPEVASLLSNPKVEIVIDDGRRWMVANPHERFDVVVENATYHWRSHATNLLSADFMELIKSRLNAGGQFAFNTTHHKGVQRTACERFESGYRLFNYMIVGDSKVAVDRHRYRQLLSDYTIDGVKVFNLDLPEHRARLDEMVRFNDSHRGARRGEWLTPCPAVLAQTEGLPLVTDDNMQPEFSRAWYELKKPVLH